MSLAPAWAKPAAILGLEMQILQLSSVFGVRPEDLEPFRKELDRIREMKA